MKQAQEFLIVTLLVIVGLILGAQISALMKRSGVAITAGEGVI